MRSTKAASDKRDPAEAKQLHKGDIARGDQEPTPPHQRRVTSNQRFAISGQETPQRLTSRMGLMENFWGDESSGALDEASGAPQDQRARSVSPSSRRSGNATKASALDDQDYDKFFTESVFNPKVKHEGLDASVSRRIQVGLYPEDAELLEEIFAQSKVAGLKGVSRARILRVALRHFHTCWLNAD